MRSVRVTGALRAPRSAAEAASVLPAHAERVLRAAQLLIMLSLLALLNLDHYWIATWGAWLVVVCLLSAPFWFNPQTFDGKNVVVRFV